MRVNFYFKNNFGFSLVGTVVAAGVASAVVLSTAYIVTQMNSLQRQAGAQSDLDRVHMLTLQKVQSAMGMTTIKNGVNSNNGVNNLLAENNPNFVTLMQACLAGTGINCTSYDTQSYPYAPGQNGQPDQFQFNTEVSATNPIQSHVNYGFSCPTSTSCSKMNIQVVTQYNSSNANVNANYHTRTTNLAIPAILIVKNPQGINFNCPSGGSSFQDINFSSNVVSCSGFTGANNCATGQPMNSFGGSGNTNCQATNTSDCSTTGKYGFKGLGLMSGQSTCSVGSNP